MLYVLGCKEGVFMKENYCVKVNNAIALCYVLDDFEQFEENLNMFIPQASHDFLIKFIILSKFGSETPNVFAIRVYR